MPAVSVVIPTRDRQATLRETLATLAAQDFPAGGCDFEVIVVLDGCRDGSRQMLEQLHPPFEMRVIDKAHGGAGAARNAGAAVARAELLLFLDDDIRADPGLVREHLAAQREHGPMVGIGRLTFRSTRGSGGLVGFLSDWWKSHDERLTREPESADSTDAYAGNICLPRSWINAVGGFAIDLARPDDVELAFRLEMAGHPFRYVPGAAGRQEFDKSPEAIRRDARLEGEGAVELLRRHPPILPRLRLASFGTEGMATAVTTRMLSRERGLEPAWRLADAVLGRSRLARRWNRWRYVHAYWQGVHAAASPELWTKLVHPPVVLMYHAFARDTEPESRFVIAQRRFAGQMRWIRRRGWPVLTARELAALRSRAELPPARAVVVTIDDAYVDAFAVALPILRRNGVRATFFVPSALLGRQLAGRSLFGPIELQTLADAGCEIAAHSRTHPRLPELSPDNLESEIDGSRADLQSLVKTPVDTFAYPYGLSDEQVVDRVRSAGFNAAFGIDPRPVAPGGDQFALPRYEVPGGLSFLRFVALLWLRMPGGLPGTSTGRQ